MFRQTGAEPAVRSRFELRHSARLEEKRGIGRKSGLGLRGSPEKSARWLTSICTDDDQSQLEREPVPISAPLVGSVSSAVSEDMAERLRLEQEKVEEQHRPRERLEDVGYLTTVRALE